MSKYDAVRNRERGEEAKKRVLERTYAPKEEQSQTSKYDVVRNRKIETPPTDAEMRKTVLDTTLAGVMREPVTVKEPLSIDFKAAQQNPFEGKLPAASLLSENPFTALQNNMQGKVPAAELLVPNGGPDRRTEYDIREERLRKSNGPEALKYLPSVLNKLAFDTAPGKFISRSLAGNSGVTQRDSTGNNVADIVSDGINNFVTPFLTPTGAPVGQGLAMAPYETAGQMLSKGIGQKAVNGLARMIPKASPSTAQNIARVGLTEGIAGITQGVGTGLMNGQDSNEEVGMNALYGGVGGLGLGLVGGAISPLVSKLFRKNGISEAEIAEITSDTLALPEGRGTIRQTTAANRSKLVDGTEPIAEPYTFKLDEASPSTVSKASNAIEGRKAVNEIDTAINDLNTRYEQAVIDEYKALKQQRDNPQGKTKGSMNFDDSGNMVSKNGWVSNNPPWYQQAMKENNYQRLSNKKLYELARKHIDEGFDVEGGRAPAWKVENGYDEQMAALTSAKETMSQSVREIDPALNITDQPLKSKELFNPLMKTDKKVRKLEPMNKPKTVEQPMKVTEQPKAEAPMSGYEKSLQGKKASELTQDDIDFLLKDADSKMNDAPEPNPVKAEVAATKEVTESAPKQTQDLFTDLFGEQNIGIVANGSRTGGVVDTADQIVRSGIKNDKDGIKETIKAQLRSVYQNNVDALDPLKKAGDEVYETAVDASRANNIANVIINDKFVNMQGEVIGDSLKDIFGKVAKGQDKNFIDFLNLKRATTRMARNEQVFATSLQMTPEKVAAKIKTLEDRYPGFEAISKDYYKFWDNVRQMGVDEGLLNKKAKEALEKAEPYYVPQNRQFSRSEKPGRSFLAKSAKSSFSGQKAPIQKLNKGGSGRDLVDARKSTVEAVGAWTNAILRNRTMQSIVKSMKANPEKFEGILSFADTTDNVKASSIKQMNEIIEKDGLEGLMNSLDDDFNMLFNKSKDINLDAENVVRAMVDGEPVYIKVQDVEILKSLLSMGPQTSSILIDTLSAFSNATKMGATGLMAPVFAIKGATMDLASSAIQSKTPLKQAAYSVYSIFSGVGDALNIPGLRNWAREYERAGGGYSYALKGERKLNKSISDITKYPVLSPQNLGKVTRNVAKSPFKTLEKVGNIFENAPRIAASKIQREALGNEITPENIRKVMNAGRDATVNYSIKGLNAREWEAIAPYTNAAVQGTRRIMVAFKKNPVRTSAAIGALVVVPKLIEYSRFHDDEDYKMIPARDRMRHTYVNKNKDGSFTKIPLDPAYTSFGEMAIEGLRSFKDNDPTAFKGSMDALVNAWTPPMLTGILQGLTKGGGPTSSLAGLANSTVFGPPSALLSNKSFTGAPIVSQAIADRSPKYQYDEKTSSLAKNIGKYTGMSPIQTDYVIKAYGGDLARLILPLTSELGKGNTRNTLLRNFITDPAFTNTLSEDFYAAKDKLNAAYADFNEVQAELPKWYDDSLRKALNSSAKGSISKQLSDLRAYKKILTSDKSLSSKQQTEKIREVQSQINDIYIQINAVLAEQGVIK